MSPVHINPSYPPFSVSPPPQSSPLPLISSPTPLNSSPSPLLPSQVPLLFNHSIFGQENHVNRPHSPQQEHWAWVNLPSSNECFVACSTSAVFNYRSTQEAQNSQSAILTTTQERNWRALGNLTIEVTKEWQTLTSVMKFEPYVL